MAEEHNRGSPRLQFTKEELEDPTLGKLAQRAEKAADAYDKAEKKLRTKHRLKLTTAEVEADAKAEVANPVPQAETTAETSFEGDVPLRDSAAPAVQNTRKRPAPDQASGKV